MIELDFSPTFKLWYENADGNPVAIKCKGCDLVSYSANDVAQRFCGFCKVFHNDIPARVALNLGRGSAEEQGCAGIQKETVLGKLVLVDFFQ